MWKRLRTAAVALLVALPIFAAEPSRDGFPAGSDTPEGAACDLARAFVQDDAALFLATCIEPFGSSEQRSDYHKFLAGIVVQMKMPSRAGSLPSPDAPKGIVKCFAARPLSQVPTSTYTAFGFEDAKFVDVVARLQNGTTQLCRTLVIKRKDGRWAVDPQPELAPSLSHGLDDESPSTQELPASAAVR